jgi:hypothetical protein
VEGSESAPPIRGLTLPAKPASPQTSSPEETPEKEPAGKNSQEKGEQTENIPVTREKIEDWLTKLRESPPVEDESVAPPLEPAPPTVPKQDLPNWVQSIEPQDSEFTSPGADEESVSDANDRAPGASSQDKPDWLKELTGEADLDRSVSSTDQHPTSDRFQMRQEELPGWLRVTPEETDVSTKPSLEGNKQELASTSPVITSPETETGDTVHIEETRQLEPEAKPTEEPPLAEQDMGRSEAESEPPSLEPARAEEIPPWIAQLKPTQDLLSAPLLPPQATEQPQVPLEPANVDEIPPWIAQLEPTEDQTSALPLLPQAIEPPQVPLEPARADEIPPWIAQLKPTQDRPSVPPQITQRQQPIEPTRAEEIPSWIAELKPADGQPVEQAPEIEGEVQIDELADWLRSPQLGTIIPTMPFDPNVEAAERSGPLANLRGVLPLATGIAEPHPALQFPPIEKKDGAHIFEDILAETQTPIQRSSRQRVRQGLLPTRLMIHAVLGLAIILALFIPPGFSGILLPISGTPAAEFYDTIESLPGNSTVLVSFDYDPSLSGEMDLVSFAILRHLVQRRINVVALSTFETGPMIARRVLAQVTNGANNYRYGTNFLNAGFVPGHESGLAQLATVGFSPTSLDFDQNQLISRYPIGANLKNIKNVPLVIELAGAEEPLRSWIEQFETRVNIRMAVASSAAVEPKARTYRDANQLTALVSGPTGAAQYEILTKQPGEAVRRSLAQSAGQIVLMMVVIAGNLAFWISRSMEKPNRSSAT